MPMYHHEATTINYLHALLMLEFLVLTTIKPHNGIVGEASGGSASDPTQDLNNKQIIVELVVFEYG